jgi:hypothetical protein
VAKFKVLSRHFPGGTEESHENVSPESRSSVRDFSPGPPEHEAGVLITQP